MNMKISMFFISLWGATVAGIFCYADCGAPEANERAANALAFTAP